MAYIGKRPQDTFPAGNAVTATTIAANAVTASEIAINAVDTSAITDGAITNAKLAANSIAVTNIPDGLLTATQMASDSVGSDQMINGAVTTAKLGTDAVTGAKIADDAIDSEHLVDGSIDTAHIGDVQVTSAKIADNSVTAAKLNIAGNGTSGQAVLSDGDGSFSYGAGGKTTEEIQDIAGAMFTSNTETGITATYEDSDGTIDLVIGTLNQNTTGSAATLGTARAIAVAGAVTGTANFDGSAGISISTTLANNAVLTQHIDDNQVTTDQIAANTIATGNIADNAVDGTKIASNSILTRHIDDDQVTGDQLADAIDVVTSVGVGGGSTNGVVISQGAIKIKNGGSQSYIDLYCESNNAHYLRLQAPAHGAFSGNPTVTFPATAGTIALTSDVKTTEQIQDIAGGMFSSNTETGITATYQDSDGTIDLVVGTLNQNTTGTAATVTEAAQSAITSVGTLTSLTTSGNLVVGGNLTVTGSTVTNSSTNTTIEDRLIELGTGTTGTPANDMGIVLERGDSANAFIGWDESADKFIVGTGTFTGASTGNLSITTGTLVANVEGNVTGNLTGTASAIADNSVTSAKIVNGTIVAADIANNAILTQHIDDNQITADQIADTTITASQIANATVTTTQIAANTIATGNVADNAIDGTKIAQNSILTRHIDDAQVTADQLASSAVTTAKVANDAITLDKMAGLARGKIIVGDASGNPVALALGSNGTVLKSDGTDLAFAADSGLSTEQVQDIVGAMFSSNTETNITATYEDSDGTIDLVVPNTLTDVTELGTLTTLTVDNIKINGTQIGHTSDEDAIAIASNGVVTFTQIPVLPDDSIGADQLAANSVVSASIVNGSIVSADIAANTIATSNIADNAVDGTKIASNSILTRHIDDNQITGDQIADNIVLSGTGAITVPDGTTGQRPGSAAAGMFRYNTTTGGFEGYTDAWGAIAGGGGSNGFLTDIFDDTTTPATDGTRTAFTMSQAVSDEKFVMVFIDGVYQAHAAYSVSGTTLTMADAPVAGRVLTVHSISATVSGDGLNINNFSGDGSDTTFTLGIDPIHENNTQVYIDGVYQFKNTYAVDGTTLTFSAAPPNGTAIEVMTHSQTNINTFPASGISGLTEVTPVAGDHVMIHDATDNALKKSDVKDLMASAVSITSSADAVAMTFDSSENATFAADVKLGDNGKAIFGAGSDLQIFHDGSNTFINNTSANAGALSLKSHDINIMSSGSETMASFVEDGAVTLYHNNVAKLATASGGVTVTGTLTATTLAGTLSTAAQTNITSLGTLTALTVDDITINGSTISDSGDLTIDTEADLTLTALSDIIHQTTSTNSTAGHHIFKSFNTEIMRIDGSNNRVGIGTDSPDDNLHIRNTAQSGATLRLENSNTSTDANTVYGTINFEGNDDSSNANGIRASIVAHSESTAGATSLRFSTGEGGSANAEKMRITNAGKVGIGSSPNNLTDEIVTITTPSSGGGQGLAFKRLDSNSDQVVGTLRYSNNSTDDLAKIIGKTDGANTSSRITLQTNTGSGLVDTIVARSNGFVDFTGAADVRVTFGSTGTAGNNDSNWVRGENSDLAFNTASGDHKWEVGGTPVARLDADGLRFGSDTAAANGLDDYEEGTWNPTLIAGTTNPTGGAYQARNGTYSKIGNRVFLTFYVGISYTNTPGGGIYLANLPYPVKNDAVAATHFPIGSYKLDINGVGAFGDGY